MFEKTMVPVLGLVENMSMFCCPNCGHATPLFGHGGARREAEALGVPFLGEVPLLLDIRTTADAGTPITASDPDSPAALAYKAIATRVWNSLAAPRPLAPRIVEA
jgi:ATP-binding protein involved in chromosome partitioning